MDKRHLVKQLAAKLREIAVAARRSSEEMTQEAREGATPAEKRDDSRVALESSSLARGQAQRADKAFADLAAIESMPLPNLGPKDRIVVGAVVEVEDEDGGRTFFLAPVGAGMELTGEDGDGILSVVTPASPVGRAVLGHRAGESVDVMVRGEARELSITFVA
jgi:transcription elongation GreA/GreB family factor